MAYRCIFILLLVTASVAAQSPPDLIIFNANVRTMDKANPTAEAIAIKDGRISAVGKSNDIRKLAGKGTKLIDAKGRLVLPGFNDAHAHFMAIGNLFSSIDLSTAKTEADVIDKLKHFARFLPKGRWILGSKLDPSIEISRAKVDAATPENPLFVYHNDATSALANKLSLELGRVESGSGVVTGTGMMIVESKRPTNHVRDYPAIAEAASNYAASFGVTSVQDTHSDDMATVYRDLHKQGKLKTRTYDCVSLTNWAKLAAIGLKAAEGDAMVRTGCVKGFHDSDDPETAMLERNIAGADYAGLQVLVHAIGKEANAAVLTAFEKAIEANRPWDRRFRIEHASGVAATDLLRFARSRIIPSMQPVLFFSETSGDANDYRKLLDSGAPLALGADAPMRGLNPLEGIYAAVNAGGKRGLTVEEAVYAYTMGAAYAEFQEKQKGSIEVGKLADVVMLSSDIFAEKANIRSAQVVLTVAGGRVVYENTN